MRGLPAHLTRLMLAGALLSHTGVNAAAQGQGGETLKMRPYGILAGCSEEPARFHPCEGSMCTSTSATVGARRRRCCLTSAAMSCDVATVSDGSTSI